MDGWAVLSALKADPGLADIPVIMLTIVDSKNPGYTLGASDYLTKPIDRDRLVTILKKYRCDLTNLNVLLVEDNAGNGTDSNLSPGCTNAKSGIRFQWS